MGMAQVAFAMAAPAVCMPAISQQLHMTPAEEGIFLSASFWGLSLAVLAAGPLADRIGFRAILSTSALFTAGGLAAISLASAQATVWAGGFILGVGAGMSDALLTPLVCLLYPQRRIRMANLLHAFYPIGLILTIAIILWLRGLGLAWPASLQALAVLALPYGLAMALLPLPGQSHQGPMRLKTRELFRKSVFLLLLASIFLAGATELGPASWLPKYVETIAGSSARGAMGLMLFGATMAAGRLGATAVVHRLGARLVFIAGAATCVVALLAAAISSDSLVTIITLSLVGLGVSCLWPTVIACAGDKYPQAGASMFSALSALGNFGGVVAPIMIGLVAEQTHSINAGIAALAIAPALAILAMARLLSGRQRPSASNYTS